ncbi:class I adenylate-forming enzyme family protein [Candidatus Poriferisodalis sp.]|uniref:class I adenylate-forming enzyme family protein n=1 Tax=Candidatus Poriferisodalis sp. TaxID=3101277 RepID=UPI003B0249F2
MSDGQESHWSRHLPAGGSAADVDLSAGGTLPAVWLDRWSTDPQRYVVWDGRDGWVTGGQLLERAQHVAERLVSAGIVAGDRVLMSGPSSSRLVAAHAALLAMGAVVVPLNGAYRADEVRGVVADCRPAAALVEGVGKPGEWHEWIAGADPAVLISDFDAANLLAGRVGAAGHSAGSADAVVPGGVGAAPHEASGFDLLAFAHQRRGDDPALIGYTSGTTGQPKGAVLSHANLLASVRALELAWRWTPDDVLVLALPLFHMHGLGVALHGTLTVGARAVLQPTFEPDAVFDAIAGRDGTGEHQATMFFGVPTMYSRLVNSPRAAQLSGLRLCASGSAPMPAELHDAVREASGQHVIERYGMTETVMLVSNPHDEPRRAGTVGFPLPGVEVRLEALDVSDGEGEPAAGPDAAEILVRGPNVFSGYWERPAENAASFSDGWFRTGDLGQWDDGYLRIVGRAKELIICGGFNVHPREVEEVIASHPDVAECAVGGEPDSEWGEVVVAYVVAERDFDDDELKDFVGERLAFYKRPRRTYRIAALPRNALGKVQRQMLGG